MSRILGVIPARWQSSRFPGKILASLCGKPLIQWVLEGVSRAERLDAVVVATDDPRIEQAVKDMGGDVVMTRADHPSGTDRVAEAVGQQPADIIINIQGDEPFVDPGLVDALAAALADEPSWDMATACTAIAEEAELNSPSVVKVVCDEKGGALYFSRSVIPYVRENDSGDGAQEPIHWRHIGIYAFRRPFLERFIAAPPCALERAEKLEQLRALHLGCNMKVLRTESRGPGVDTPEDLAAAERVMKEAGYEWPER